MRTVTDRVQEKDRIPVYGYSWNNKGQRKWPDVIKLKACVKHSSLLHAKGLAHLQGECDYSALQKEDRGWGEKIEWGDEMGWHLRERRWLSLTLISLLFISNCQGAIFSYDLVLTPSEAVTLWITRSQSGKSQFTMSCTKQIAVFMKMNER